jgi:methanogenic corrinoid protein MtbC1
LRDILTPALAYVGQLWHDEKLSIAQEHMFSSSVKRILLSMVHNMHSLSGNRPSMLFATPPGEPHVLGILMCCLLAAEQHYNCYYLGANMPVKDLLDASQKLKVDIIVLGLVKTPPDAETLAELAVLRAAPYAQKIKVWMGGSGAAQWMAYQETVPASFELLADLDDFHSKASIQRQLL